MAAASIKTNIYIDGFNLYYGALKGTRFKWLDVKRLCELTLQPRHVINRIRYFTAHVTALPNDPGQPSRQQIYLRALRTIPNLTVHRGHFLSHPVDMPLASPPPSGPRTARVIKTEEKGSDVNLASYLLLDAFKGDYEAAVVLSNDSDLTTPIRIVRTELGLPVGVINPKIQGQGRPSIQLKKAALFHVTVKPADLAAAQFPRLLKESTGKTIKKPASW